MWQRRPLVAELGSADATVQLSVDVLKRYTSTATRTTPAPTVAIIGGSTGSGSVVHFPGGGSATATLLPPGTEWSLTQSTRRVSVSSIALAGLGNAGGVATAIWAVSLAGSDTSQTRAGKFLRGGIVESSPLGELVQQYEGLNGRRGPSLINTGLAKPVVTVSSESSNSWSIPATLITPVQASVDGVNGTINVRPTVVGATLTATATATADLALAQSVTSQLATRMSELLAGQLPALCPAISLVGAIGAGEMLPELMPLSCVLRSVGGATATALGVYIGSNVVVAPPATPADLTGGSDCAFLARGAVFQKTINFAFRTGRFPTHRATGTTTEQTSNGASVLVTASFDFTAAQFALVPFAPADVRQEDHAAFTGQLHSTIVSIKMADGSAPPASVVDSIVASDPPPEVESFYYSNVGAPSIQPDPQYQAWITLFRAQVSSRFSRPFASALTTTLQERALNGVEQVMLSRTTLGI